MKQKEWYQTSDLVDAPMMPSTIGGVNYKAKTEGWIKRKPEGVKGRAFEYHIDSLPEITRLYLKGQDAPSDSGFYWGAEDGSQEIKTEDEKLTKIPYYEIYASAGNGAIVPGEGESAPCSIDIHPQILINNGISPSGLFSMPVKGDSMEPTLFDGDIIVVKRASPPLLVLEGVYVIRIGNELFIKRIQFNKFEAFLQVDSDNSFYRSYTIRNEDLNQVEIIGEAVLTLGRIKRITLAMIQKNEPEH